MDKTGEIFHGTDDELKSIEKKIGYNLHSLSNAEEKELRPMPESERVAALKRIKRNRKKRKASKLARRKLRK